MHFVFVVSSLLGLTTCFLWLYLSYQSEKIAADFAAKGIFKKEEILFYTYTLAQYEVGAVTPEKVAQLKSKLDRISQITAPYYGILLMRSWCYRISMISALVAFLMLLVEKGILK
jgi:hypothetical protein